MQYWALLFFDWVPPYTHLATIFTLRVNVNLIKRLLGRIPNAEKQNAAAKLEKRREAN